MWLREVKRDEKKGRIRLLFDDDTLVLYDGELREIGFDLTDMEQLPACLAEDMYGKIVDLLAKRAKRRALYLLERKGRTSRELHEKLIDGGFGSEASRQAVQYAMSFGYVNDREYIRSYILGRMNRKSKKEITYALRLKKLPDDMISDVMQEVLGEDSEYDAVRRLLEKKRYAQVCEDEQKKVKIMAYLARKGFSYDTIRKACDDIRSEDVP